MCKKQIFLATAALISLSAPRISAQETAGQIKWYGFIRNYAHVDSHESVSGTADLFNYLPKDNDNNTATYHLSAITSRLGVDVTGYKFNNLSATAKIEADFYNGVSGVTGTAVLRLRQAYVTLGTKNETSSSTIKIGQAWHPMASDMPDVISLNTGAPFGPFSRTPLAQYDYSSNNGLGITAAVIWQQQYTSAGPSGASADYQKYSPVPEIYVGVNLISDNGLVRLGVDMVNISPNKDGKLFTTISPFLYAQYKKDLFSVKFKTVYAQAGEHLNLNGGYALASDGEHFTPTRNSSNWVSLSYGKKWQGVLFGGYVKNYGTAEAIVADASKIYFSKNSFSNMNAMWRLTPTVIRNIGKITLALEYEVTSVQYGDNTKFNFENALADKELHWVTNNRLQFMVKYAF
ncbi:MAG: hypothetical protein HUJ91_06945 [Bacteroidales bacterium]|nr:hypothetical protein [Bacteroidales bacterium]MCF0178389.1 hypothetical protein [Bacteroidales bacterium]